MDFLTFPLLYLFSYFPFTQMHFLTFLSSPLPFSLLSIYGFPPFSLPKENPLRHHLRDPQSPKGQLDLRPPSAVRSVNRSRQAVTDSAIPLSKVSLVTCPASSLSSRFFFLYSTFSYV